MKKFFIEAFLNEDIYAEHYTGFPIPGMYDSFEEAEERMKRYAQVEKGEEVVGVETIRLDEFVFTSPSMMFVIYSREPLPKHDDTKKPFVGMGVTRVGYSEYAAFTVMKVSPTGAKIWLRRDVTIRTDNNGMSDIQEYEFFSPYQSPAPYWITANRGKDGRYYCQGTPFVLGSRRSYYDFTF